jgi:hypothetical protein
MLSKVSSSNSTLITALGSRGSGNGQFDDPVNMAVNSQSSVYVTDLNHSQEEFSLPPTLLTLANLSKSVYYSVTNPVGRGYKDSSGTYTFKIDNFSAPISQISKEFRAAEYINVADPHEIVIAFRGTDLTDSTATTIKNLVTDISFLGKTPNQQLISYIQEAVAFLQYIEQQNSGGTITLTGHSLGGAIAQILGAASGLTTDVFNAPGAGQLYSSLLPYLQPIVNNDGNQNNTNYRIYGDQVSLTGTAIGTEITLPATPAATYSFSDFSLIDAVPIFQAHNINTVITQIGNLQAGVISPVSSAGEISLAPLLEPLVNLTITQPIINFVDAPLKTSFTLGTIIDGIEFQPLDINNNGTFDFGQSFNTLFDTLEADETQYVLGAYDLHG